MWLKKLQPRKNRYERMMEPETQKTSAIMKSRSQVRDKQLFSGRSGQDQQNKDFNPNRGDHKKFTVNQSFS